MTTINDARVAAGMTRQFADRTARIGAGERPIGWKLGFGTAAALEKFALSGPLVGYMMEASRHASGATADVGGWVKTVVEPEIAVRVGADFAAGDAAVAIDAFAPALELADMHFPPEDVEAILAGNIYHRFVVLGEFHPASAGFDWSRLRATVSRNGAPYAAVDDVEANTGAFPAIVRHCAETLLGLGETLRKGDVIILGSVVPPIFRAPEDSEVSFAIDGVGSVSSRFR